jgi:large subunit ribosomal protein L13
MFYFIVFHFILKALNSAFYLAHFEYLLYHLHEEEIMRQTTFPKGTNNEPKKWYLVDAKDAVLGRVASRIAMKLLGKDDPNFTTYLNDGSGVIVINARHIKVTGNKLEKPFYWHTGYAGGIKERTIAQRLESKDPGQVLMTAVKRMLGKGPLGRSQLKNLRIFADDSHTHMGQKPEVWDLKSEHKMNVR